MYKHVWLHIHSLLPSHTLIFKNVLEFFYFCENSESSATWKPKQTETLNQWVALNKTTKAKNDVMSELYEYTESWCPLFTSEVMVWNFSSENHVPLVIKQQQVKVCGDSEYFNGLSVALSSSFHFVTST